MKLIGTPGSPYTRKVRIVLAEKKIDYDFEIRTPSAPDSKVSEFNPLGKVPVLVLDDGSTVFDSRVIVEFLDNVSPFSRLIPAGNRERIEVRRWEALADGILDASLLVRAEGRRDKDQRNPAWMEKQMEKVRLGIAWMDRELGEQPFCSGNNFNLADIAVGACVGWLDFRFDDLNWRGEHANLTRLVAKLAERPSFADTMPQE